MQKKEVSRISGKKNKGNIKFADTGASQKKLYLTLVIVCVVIIVLWLVIGPEAGKSGISDTGEEIRKQLLEDTTDEDSGAKGICGSRCNEDALCAELCLDRPNFAKAIISKDITKCSEANSKENCEKVFNFYAGIDDIKNCDSEADEKSRLLCKDAFEISKMIPR